MDSAALNMTNAEVASLKTSVHSPEGGKGFLFALWICFGIAFITAPLFYSERIRTWFIKRFFPSRFRSLDEDVVERIRRERRRGAEQDDALESDISSKREFLESLLESFTVELAEEHFKDVERSQWATLDSAIGNTRTKENLEAHDSTEQNLMTVVVLPAPMRSVEEVGKPESTEVHDIVLDESLTRMVSCTCAICLETYSPEDQVCWSSSETCQHAFHKECLIEWFSAYMKRCVFDDVSALTCPCCRQSFVDTRHRQICTIKKASDVVEADKIEGTEETESAHDLEEGSAISEAALSDTVSRHLTEGDTGAE